MNPFSEEYFATELAYFGLQEPYSKNGLSVWLDEQGIPFLKFDDTIWMTLKPKIVQTHYLSIARAKGAVLTGGLGLGYFPLRIAAKENVQRVDVYELDERVIDFFKERFSDRPEMKKINLIHGDMRELASGHYDYALIDIYVNPISSISRVLEDLAILQNRVTVSRFQVWCEELILRVGIVQELDILLEDNERKFLDYWGQAPLSISETLNQLYGEAFYHLSPRTIQSYLSLVNRPVKSYYLPSLKWGIKSKLPEGIKQTYRKLRKQVS
jgi:hypothetical protein